MSDLISRQALRDAMYHQAFETDTEMQRWDSGCWIRYKLFENVIENLPSAEQPSGDLISRRTLYIHLEDMAFEVAPNGKKHGKDEYLIRQTKYETIQQCMEEVQKLPSEEHGVNADNLIKKIKRLEPLNNKDCPEWVYKVIEGEK